MASEDLQGDVQGCDSWLRRPRLPDQVGQTMVQCLTRPLVGYILWTKLVDWLHQKHDRHVQIPMWFRVCVGIAFSPTMVIVRPGKETSVRDVIGSLGDPVAQHEPVKGGDVTRKATTSPERPTRTQ